MKLTFNSQIPYIGHFLRDARRRKKVKADVIAKYIAVHTGTLYSYERGAMTLRKDVVQKICRVLKIDFNDLPGWYLEKEKK